ncbi:MAG: PAS domain S-box protein [Elusimicrobia bacterium]|nr:PAS domain S-box protein [Elusimicrobiota bacterium]
MKKEEKTLTLKESLFDSLFDASSEKMMVIDPDGVVRFINKAALEILGYERADIIDKNFKTLIIEKDYAEFDNFLSSVRELEIVRNYKFYLLTLQKSIIRLFLTGVLLGDRGVCAGYCISLSPVYPDEWIALKDPHFFQMVAKKLGRLTSVGQLTSVFVHDIKNPLHVILSTAELVLSFENLDDDLKNSMALIERNAARASRIVKTLLDFSKSGICQLRPYSLNEIVDYCLGLLESSLKTSRVNISRDMQDVPKVFLDPHYLHSVVYNLLTNAVEALPEKSGKILIRTGLDPAKNEAALTISDNGVGISPNMLSHLYQPFFTTKETGTGLGLYLARQIMNEHSGRISIESKPGKGTTVSLIFTKIA